MILYTVGRQPAPFEIDDADYEAVSHYVWRHGSRGAIVTGVMTDRGPRYLSLANFLLGKPAAGLWWDHWDRNPANNKRANLRAVTRTVNARNRRVSSNNRSGVTGVRKLGSQWWARLYHEGERLHLGYFDTFEEAVAARKDAEDLYWGDER